MKSALVLALLVGSQAVAHAQAPQAKAPQAPGMSLQSAQAEHLRAIKQATAGDIKGGIRALQQLSLKKFNETEKDRVFLSMGRFQYEIGQYDNAIASYAQVQKTGPSWLEAVEETAWAQFREGHPQETIAKLKTATSPAFKDNVKSEPFFLMGLAQLRVCDFKGVFKTIEQFKDRFGQKAKDLEKSPSATSQASLKEIGDTVQKLNLVEAEVIQRLYVDENGKKRSGSTPKITKDSDQLSFPDTGDDEFWLDEVDGYKVSLKGCMKPEKVQAKNEVK